MSAAVTKAPRKAATSKKTASHPQTDLAAAFARGRDHAIAMMREAVLLGSAREPWRSLRDGEAQDNLVAAYLGDLDRDVSLRPGFTAILSAAIQNEIDLSALASITMAETQAGAIGEDGTMVLPAANPKPEAAPVPAEASPKSPIDEVADILDSAEQILDDLLEGLNDSAPYGAHTLLKIAQRQLGQSAQEQTEEAIDNASIAINEACSVLACVNGKFESIRVQGVVTLLGLAKEKHDVIVSAFYAAKRGAAE